MDTLYVNDTNVSWSPTMRLRWVDSLKANDLNNAVPFSNNIGWGQPDNVVLQQQWQGSDGTVKWEDIKLEL